MTDMLISYRGAVYPWHCDHVGHMNVMWYVAKFDEATWQLFCQIGLTPSFLRDAKRGMAAVDQRISYIQELRAGDVVTVRSGVLEVKDKSLRFLHEMWNDETNVVASRTVLTAVYLDIQARKSCPFPEAVVSRAVSLVVAESTR